ncbi:RecA-superfamily ATPase, KaiC/GvpD/RAD55 family [Natronoarchaeum philippinense]|uniref:RecA-superfamily ATPase, KaiC/GvpD/RAD55 family n=1 Tax=Natronoarchaeum philippinense TaxID=558529 RepID=A0A285N6T4_NATPI|nr:ATPase domain-containing protein [Natronoarchaeum philippinense]SNZ05184.1 RecA-superfamily ATPase, KaiC/GvpD/RAD55 family [Natronoarchaeum philippinense]
MSRQFRTGIDLLDRHLGGGIPAGSVVALTAPPASQSELLLYELVGRRRTLYLSAERTADDVRSVLDEQTSDAAGRASDAEWHVRETRGDDQIDRATRLLRSLADDALVIVDPVDALERSDRRRYRRFLAELRDEMEASGGVAVLHCLDGRDAPPLRDVTEYMADVVFDLSTEVQQETVRTRLRVPKFRNGAAPTDVIRLQLTDEVAVDHSREIA